MKERSPAASLTLTLPEAKRIFYKLDKYCMDFITLTCVLNILVMKIDFLSNLCHCVSIVSHNLCRVCFCLLTSSACK